MAATTKVPLGASTTNRKWYLDVDTSETSTPNWVGVFGLLEFKDALEPSLQDDSDFDSEGWKSSTSTANMWSIEAKVKRAVTSALGTAYDPGQEKLRAAAGSTGTGNRVQIRWYEMEPNGPRVEAYSGYAAVTWSPDGGGMDALSTVAVTLTGQGKRNVIAHPDD
jgi:hypothetical protein